MILISGVLARLNSQVPLKERCQFAKEVCDRPGISFTYKESVIVNWLFQELEKDEPKNSADIWSTLHYVLEHALRGSKGNSILLLKNSFADAVLKHVEKLLLVGKYEECLVTEILMCFSVVLFSSSTSHIFLKQHNVLLKILSALLKIINSYVSSKNVPKDLQTVFFTCFKNVLDSEVLTSEKVVDTLVRHCLEPWVTYVQQDLTCFLSEKNEYSNLIIKWLKSVLCHPCLDIAYKRLLKLESAPKVKTRLSKTVRTLMVKIKDLLQSDYVLLNNCGSRIMTIILQGMLEKRNQKSADIPFGIFVHFTDFANDFDDAEKMRILNPLLEVCALNPALVLRNGTITTATKIGRFKELAVIFAHREDILKDLFKFFELLLSINPEIIDSQLEMIWYVSCVNAYSMQNEAQIHLFCSLLKTYGRLRQVPKLFSKLTERLNKLSEPPANTTIFPKTFVVQFAECVVSLPTGQTLQLWQILLNALKFLYLETEWKFPSVVQLCSVLLLHMKLTENDVPASKQGELRELLHNTMLFLQSVLMKNLLPDCDILNLCHSWGEVVLTLKLYHTNCSFNVEFSETQDVNDLFDLSALHPYLSASEWTTCLSNIESSDERLQSCVVSLLIQKIRSFPILNSSDLDDIAKESSNISRYLFECIYDRFQDNISNTDLWDSFVSWFPVFLPALRSKKLGRFCKSVVRSMMSENSKTENYLARIVMKSSCVFELRPLQTALLTSLWDEAENSVCMKRKFDEYNNNLLWRRLSNPSQMWQEHSATKPEVENEMWQEIKTAAVEFEQQCQDDHRIERTVNVERAVQLVRMLCFFPLEDMELGNQFRCILGLLQLFIVLAPIRNCQKSELSVMICQMLMSLLNKMPASRMALFFKANVLLPEVYRTLGHSENAEERKWNKALFERIVYISMGDTTAQTNVDTFAMQLTKRNGSCALETEVLQIIVTCYLAFLRRYELSNNTELFKTLDPSVEALVKTLSKRLLTTQDLDCDLVCKCLTSILTYHCRTVPDHLKVSKRRPQKFLKKHLNVVESLTSCSVDNATSQSLYQLVGLICKNRLLFDEQLPERFVMTIWEAILNTCLSNETADFSAIFLLVKSLKPPELSLLVNRLNSRCISLLNSDTSRAVSLIPIWNTILNVNFGTEIPREVGSGVAEFLNMLLPQLLRPIEKCTWVTEVVLPTLKFVSDLLQKPKIPIRHSQVVVCFQTVSSLNPALLEPIHAVALCDVLVTIYRRLLNRVPKVILQSVAPFVSCLSTVLKQLVRIGNQKNFHHYNDELKKAVILCTQDFSKLLAVLANHKTEFCKQAGFFISDYVFEIQDVTVHTLVKEQILLGIYKILDICDEHVMAMLQISLPSGGRELLKQIHADFNQHYRYRGKV